LAGSTKIGKEKNADRCKIEPKKKILGALKLSDQETVSIGQKTAIVMYICSQIQSQEGDCI
jgi:hypothetical protein